MGIMDKFKGKVKGTGDWLKQKWPAGSLKRGPREYTKEEREKITAGMGTLFKPPRKGYYERLKGPPLWALGRAGKMFKREEKAVQPAQEPEKKSLFGRIKEKYKEWSKKRSEAKRRELLVEKERVCLNPQCGTIYVGTAVDPCPRCGLHVEQQKKAAKLVGKPVREKLRGKSTSIVLSLLSVLGMVFGFIMGMPPVIMIVCGVALGFLIISFFLPSWFRGILLIGFLGIMAFFAWSGQFEPFVKLIPPVYAESIKETFEDTIYQVTRMWEKSRCYMKVDPTLVQACLKQLEEREKGEIANPYKEYQTLEVKLGNPYLNYEYDLIEKGKPYDLELNFINKNEKTFEIELVEINVSTDGYEGSGLKSYTLEPGEEKYVRFSFLKDAFEDCTSKTFRVKVKSRQEGGATSDFGLAPSEKKEEWKRFIRGFKPNPIADPGPLNIYAFTYPAGIDTSKVGKKFKVIIKIKNPKVEGIAEIREFYFVQRFKHPTKYFQINTKECRPDVDCVEISSTKLGECDPETSNCLKFNFKDPQLGTIKQGESREIVCNATILKQVPDKYTDFIGVYATYNFTQEWEFSIGCTEPAW
jgi:hypothetical protein